MSYNESVIIAFFLSVSSDKQVIVKSSPNPKEEQEKN